MTALKAHFTMRLQRCRIIVPVMHSGYIVCGSIATCLHLASKSVELRGGKRSAPDTPVVSPPDTEPNRDDLDRHVDPAHGGVPAPAVVAAGLPEARLAPGLGVQVGLDLRLHGPVGDERFGPALNADVTRLRAGHLICLRAPGPGRQQPETNTLRRVGLRRVRPFEAQRVLHQQRRHPPIPTAPPLSSRMGSEARRPPRRFASSPGAHTPPMQRMNRVRGIGIPHSSRGISLHLGGWHTGKTRPMPIRR